MQEWRPFVGIVTHTVIASLVAFCCPLAVAVKIDGGVGGEEIHLMNFNHDPDANFNHSTTIWIRRDTFTI